MEVGLEDVVEDLEAEEATSEVDHQVSVFVGVQVATSLFLVGKTLWLEGVGRYL